MVFVVVDDEDVNEDDGGQDQDWINNHDGG